MITIEINEHTKAGKALLAVARIFSKEKTGVRIIEKSEPDARDLPGSQNVPNAETLKVFEENDKKGTKDLKKYQSTRELFDELGI